MILTGMIIAALIAAYVAAAMTQTYRLGIGFSQAVLYLPLKLAYRISDSRIRTARQADAPVVYAIAHQSQLDPALMLALLPEDTLHILDEASARSPWLEPVPDARALHRLQRLACLRQPPSGAPSARQRPPRGLFPADGRAGRQDVQAVPRGGPHRRQGRHRHRADPHRHRPAPADVAGAGIKKHRAPGFPGSTSPLSTRSRSTRWQTAPAARQPPRPTPCSTASPRRGSPRSARAPYSPLSLSRPPATARSALPSRTAFQAR